MTSRNRRQFMGDVGRGMLTVGLGASTASMMGFSTAFAEEGAESLSFGELDALVDLMQSTPPDRLQPLLVNKLQAGEADLPRLISAAALANAETFGGQDYVGFHTAMAMLPALELARVVPKERQPLPVLKVLYRNSGQIQEQGGAATKMLHPLAAEKNAGRQTGGQLRDAVRDVNMDGAEQIFAGMMQGPTEDAYNDLQPIVQDDINVHRFVLAHRAYQLVSLLGAEHAHTILRQCVRFCVDHEEKRVSRNNPPSAIRTVLPALFDQYKLEGIALGEEDPGDEWVDELAQTIYGSPPEQAAEAAAAALAEGVDPEVVGEAISLASNLLVLRQGTENWRTHGDSAGVHTSDAANAWRNMARCINDRNAIAGLIVGAFHTARYQEFSGAAYPTEEHLAEISSLDPDKLLAEAADAVENNDQGRAAAAIHLYGEHGRSAEPVFNLMARYTVSEDGRLHGEKYFQTVREEYATTREAFRWRQMVGLARVTASAYGYDREDQHGHRAPGYEDACRLLGVEV